MLARQLLQMCAFLLDIELDALNLLLGLLHRGIRYPHLGRSTNCTRE